jgi:hypothetical protein
VPHFTLQVSSNGPILQAFVAVSQARSDALAAAGRQLPDPVSIRALVDTGASCTCVDPSVLITRLGLTPTGSVNVNTPSTGSTPHRADQFDVALIIPAATGAPALVLQTIPVVSSELLGGQGFHALIGRDILDRCLFVYNGAVKLFTLAF